MKRIRVGVIYGGKSGEHEVSVASAASIFRHLDRSRYDAVPLFIQKDGRWTLGAPAPQVLSAGEVLRQHASQALQPIEPSAAVGSSDVDVVFPVLHGPYGEDGTVQGLLELANIPYVGAGVLGSAVGMDKAVMKTLFAAQGLPIVPHLVIRQPEWAQSPSAVAQRVADVLLYPVFVKPANLGSSVGVSKAAAESELAEALATAFDFDRKAVVEAAVPKAREIECAVLGNDDPEASVPGEIVPWGDFYDYKAKYLEDRSQLLIPAPLDAPQVETIRRLAIQAFGAVEGAGMARVDFLMAGETGEIFVNEVNTIPGFTTISMYPKLWEASGLSYSALLDRLITLALERHADKQRLRTSIA